MVDIFALAVSHGLLALAVWRLLARGDLFDESTSAESKSARRGMRAPGTENAPDA